MGILTLLAHGAVKIILNKSYIQLRVKRVLRVYDYCNCAQFRLLRIYIQAAFFCGCLRSINSVRISGKNLNFN